MRRALAFIFFQKQMCMNAYAQVNCFPSVCFFQFRDQSVSPPGSRSNSANATESTLIHGSSS